MQTLEQLNEKYASKIKSVLYELRTSGASADEIWETLDKLRDEYAEEYQLMEFNMMKHAILKL